MFFLRRVFGGSGCCSAPPSQRASPPRPAEDTTSEIEQPEQRHLFRSSTMTLPLPRGRGGLGGGGLSDWGHHTMPRPQSTAGHSPGRSSWRTSLRSLFSGLGQPTEEQLAAEAQGRERVLLELTQAVQALVQEGAEVDGNRGQGAVVTVVGGEAEHPRVRALCLAVEQACLHGTKTQEFHGQLPFWDLLEAAAAQDKQEDEGDPHAHAQAMQDAAGSATVSTTEGGADSGGDGGQGERGEEKEGERALRAVVERVRGQAHLKTPVGLARSALRHALHDGTLDLLLRHLAAHHADAIRRFYGRGAVLLHADCVGALVDTLRSLTRHCRLQLAADAARPSLDEEPDWPLLDFDTVRRRQRQQQKQDRGILASTLLEDLTTFHLEEGGEEAALERFRAGGGGGGGGEMEGQKNSFNSSAKRTAQRDPVLDALLESSGVHLRRLGSVNLVVADGEEQEEAAVDEGGGVVGSGAPDGFGRGEGVAAQQEQQQQTMAAKIADKKEEEEEGEGTVGGALARLHLLQAAKEMEAAAAAAATHAPTPTHASGSAPLSPRFVKGSSRSLPCSPYKQRGADEEVPIRFHHPSHLSGLPSPPSSSSPHDDHDHHHDDGAGGTLPPAHHEEQQHVPPPHLPSRLTSASAPVVLSGAQFLLNPEKRRAFKPSGSHLFGEPLAHLVRDPNTCRLALLEPSLGLPFIFEEMIDFLFEHAPHTPALFETRVASWRVTGLSRVLDEYQEIPPGTDPHVVAAALVLALRMLPEPLLTYERYHSFLAAARLVDPSERHAAIKALLHDLPLEHKPTLRHLAHMLWRACHHPAEDDASDIALQHPNHGRRSHLPHDFERTIAAPLSARTLAPILARSLLRPYVPPPPSKAAPPPDQPPEAGALVRALIDEYPPLFHELREVEARKAQALQEKVQRLAVLVEETRLPALTDDPECAPLFRRLFRCLARVERRIYRACHVTASPTSSTHGMGDVSSPPRRRRAGSREGRPTRAKSSSPRLRSPSAAARVVVGESNGEGGGHHSEHERRDSEEEDDEHFSFSSPRWETCGFIRGDPGAELGPSGKAALKGIVHFCRRFPAIAQEMLFQYAHHGRKGQTISFPGLAGQVMRLVLALLHLLPPAGGAPLSLAAFAGAPHWRLLDEPHAVEEVFCVALTLVDFLHFHEALPLALVEPHLLEAKRQLTWTLAQGPLHAIALWELWLGLRAELRRRYRQQAQQQQQQQPPSASSTPHGEKEEEEAQEAAGGRAAATAGPLLAVERDPLDANVTLKVHHGVRTRVIGRSAILEPWHVLALERALPEMQQDYDWVLLYSLKQHGASLISLFERCRGHSASLLVVKDEDGVVFGGYATDEWRNKEDAYYGDGQCFLFSFSGGRFAKYGWTHKNNYFQLGNARRGLAMGGGGHFGLMLDGELHRGSSDTCATFDNQPLAGRKTFSAADVEVWGFQSTTLCEAPSPSSCLPHLHTRIVSGSGGEGSPTRHRRGSSGSSGGSGNGGGRQRHAPHRAGLAEHLRTTHDYTQQEGKRAV